MLWRQASDLFPGGPGFTIMRSTSQAASEAAAHDADAAQPSSVLAKHQSVSGTFEKFFSGKGGSASFGGPDDVAHGARCHVHVTANCTGDAAKSVPDVNTAHTTGPHSAVGGDLLAKAPPPLPAAIFTAAKNKLLDGGGSGTWSPLSPGGTGASAQLAQLLGLFDEQAGGGGLGRSITESSDFILRELTAAGGFRDLEGDSSLDELDDVGGHHHHHGSHLPALLPVSTDVSGCSSPTRFGGQDSPTLQQDIGLGALRMAVGHNTGGGFGSPFMGGAPAHAASVFRGGFSAFPALSSAASHQPVGLSSLQTLSAPADALPQGMVPVEWPQSVFLSQQNPGFLSQPVHLRDAGRAASMPAPFGRGAAPSAWQPPVASDDASRRRPKRQMESAGVVKRKGSAPDLNMAAMAINEAGPKPKTTAKRGPGEKARKSRRMRCQYCKTHQTPQWRGGPNGPRTLCNACGVRWNKGKLEVNGRPMPLSPSSGSDLTP